jgi:general secretion pathway protein D
LTARSGGAAQIQVGSDVPIITSQRAASTQDGIGNTDILQSVDYRSTGVLLSIEPIVFGDNRVDLSITQEVSTAIPTSTSDIASPTISNRSITTQLSLEDGATAILGGLIQENTTRDETGTPLLKDIPFVGNLFRNTTLSNTRTELVVLITAYVVRDGEEKQAFTDELVNRFNLSISDPDQMNTYIGER